MKMHNSELALSTSSQIYCYCSSSSYNNMASNPQDAALKEQLRAEFVGKSLHQVPTPSVILDLAKLEVNCERMLDATETIGLLWRPHIKTHKTTELTRLQVGDTNTTPASIIVSTIIEAENVLPLLKEYQSKGRDVNILYSFPLFPSAVPRLAAIATQLGPNSVSLIIDHPDQLSSVEAIHKESGHPPQIFVKIDGGYHRAGVIPSSPQFSTLITAILALENKDPKPCIFHGLYIHAGHSYYTRESWQAMQLLAEEFKILVSVADSVREHSPGHPLVLSVGATPTATTIQHPDFASESKSNQNHTLAKELDDLFIKWKKEDRYGLEVHAGVYPTLDLQQLSTHARDTTFMKADDIAVSVLAEVASIYPNRGPHNTDEVLINTGCLALGREPVADKGKVPGEAYSGWGFVMPWGVNNPVPGENFPQEHEGWQVGRISQEHGILVWHGSREGQEKVPLAYGQRVRVWPNHSCIAGAGFDHYLVVDSRNKGREDEVVDVWPRWRGW
ncbi:D-serine dehydratase [Podospora australis]|uniref:D-serine dehydratase n=1 Tax=Podospora australis TaxID=1536484 RepID=A0AAN6X3E4_9PEZI|nr:D-serine dehydratase [Podospora australis]